MTFGIPEKSMSLIIKSLKKFKEIKKAAFFGSRALGNYKNGSDADIVLYGPNITAKIVNQISIKLNEELPLPYYFDIVHYESLSTEDLKEHIDTYAKKFYSSEN